MQIKTKSPEEQLKKKLKSKLFSMKGAFWEERELNSFQKNQLIKTFNLTNIFANLLTSRGVNVETYKSFLSPKLKDLFPDPSQMDQMDLATKKIVEFIIPLTPFIAPIIKDLFFSSSWMMPTSDWLITFVGPPP